MIVDVVMMRLDCLVVMRVRMRMGVAMRRYRGGDWQRFWHLGLQKRDWGEWSVLVPADDVARNA